MCGAFVQENFYGYGIAYTITAAISMRSAPSQFCCHLALLLQVSCTPFLGTLGCMSEILLSVSYLLQLVVLLIVLLC